MSVERGRGWLGRGRVVVAAVAAWLTLAVTVAPGQGSAEVFDTITTASEGPALSIEAKLAGAAIAGEAMIVSASTSFDQVGSDIVGEAEFDSSGRSVSLSSDGTIVAIGAIGNDGTGSNSGHVRLYEWNGSAWQQKGNDIDGEAAGDFSGISTSLSSDGTIVAIGAYSNDDNGSNSGHVRVYSTTTTLSITYDSQGGSSVSDGDATTSTGGTISALPTDPTRDGYTFAGWFTAASDGTQITAGSAHNQTADFTLYAQWTANPTTTTTEAPTTTSASTTTVAPMTTVGPTTTIVLPATGPSNGAASQVLLVLGIGGLLVLFTRRRLDARA